MAELNIVLPTVRMARRLSSGLRTSPRPKKAAKSKWRRATRLAQLNAYVENEDAFVNEGLNSLRRLKTWSPRLRSAGTYRFGSRAT